VVYPSGTASVTLGYDALNRLTNMVDGIGTTKCRYAMLGNGLRAESGIGEHARPGRCGTRLASRLLTPQATAQMHYGRMRQRQSAPADFLGSRLVI
jgi:hypothetical protein